MNKSRFVFCQYCDDIRQEANGKLALMGVYLGGMNVLGPAGRVLPKLCVIIHIRLPVEEKISSLRFEIKLNDRSLQVENVPKAALAEMNRSDDPDAAIQIFTIQSVLEGLKIDESGYLDVVVTLDGEEFWGNRLPITLTDKLPTFSTTPRVEPAGK